MAHFDLKTFNPEAFGRYVDRIPNLKRNELLKSGALVSRNDLNALFDEQTGSFYATVPVRGLIDGEAQNYDGETDVETTTTTTYSQGMIVVGRMKAWTEKDFSQDITSGVNFMDNVAAQVAEYWDEVDQDTLLSVLNGIFSMTGAENKKFVDNHTYDITKATDTKVGATTLNNAIQKACGDNKKAFSLAIMHSQVATNLENLQVLEYLKYTDANGIQRSLEIATWNGRLVIVDDSMPTAELEGSTQYTTYVLGKGAFEYANVGCKVPYEMDRNPYKNGGVETLITRQRKVFAPKGISFTKKSVAKLSPTKAELENGANWSLIKDASESKTINHKAIAIARIVSLG